MEKTKPERPFSLEHADAKNNIGNAITDAVKRGVPCYLLEEILSGFLHQVRAGAESERKSAREKYEKQLAEYEKQGD